ncbi:MAG: protein kinase [Kofleriaceae bacterium]
MRSNSHGPPDAPAPAGDVSDAAEAAPAVTQLTSAAAPLASASAAAADGDEPDPAGDRSDAEARQRRISDLIRQHKHAAAAELALAAGEPGRAAELFEQVWDFARAAAAARAAGDLPRALRCALSARDAALVDGLVAELCARDGGIRQAAELLQQQRRWAQAAPLLESLGELEAAAAAYERGHLALEAARLYQQLGHDRKAGQLLERALELAAGQERSALLLALGRLLARRGAYPEAAERLQEARRDAALRQDATLELIAALAALGMRDGARDLLIELRRHRADVAPDLDGFLRAWRDRPESRPASRERELIGGRYRLDKLLGAGGSGRVFLAVDEITGRQVAVKMFFAIDARGGAAFERFAREAQLAQTLRHPSLVEVLQVSVDLGFLVMEVLPGGSLAQRLAQGERPSGQQVRRMALELIDGLSAAHHRGIVHRDVKPANVFFDARGTAKLGDFGVAHLLDLGQTQTGGLIGTLAYMAPEQITGAPITVAADLYGLGVTLFEALTGRLPFLGPDFVAQHLGEEPPLVHEVDPGVAPAWSPVLSGLLRKNPTERTAGLVELRAEISSLDLAGRALPVGRRETRPLPTVASVAADGADDAEPRYQFETPLGTTAISSLVRAVDTVLQRTVILEYFDETDAAAAMMERVRLIARAHTPFVQRALSLHRQTRMVVFEAPSGSTLAEERPRLAAAELVRVLKRLARGIAAIHELGGGHGGIELRTVVLDDGNNPTVLVSGLGEARPACARDDVAAVLSLVAHLAGAAPSLPAIAAQVAASAGAHVPTLPSDPEDGEALYAAADALDVAVLTALGARAP